MREQMVLRMLDGSVKKCATFSRFSAAHAKVKVVTTEGSVESVDLDDVKAIFFVRDLMGDPSYTPKREFHEGSPLAGKAVTVRFPDGEMLRGRVINLAEKERGFFLFPADPLENNRKVFVVRRHDTLVEVEP
jgi:hypothetical protein